MSSRALDDPVLERRRLAALDQIRQIGDPVLRAPALPVTEFDDALRDEVERMVAIMNDARGVGLAASSNAGDAARRAVEQADQCRERDA